MMTTRLTKTTVFLVPITLLITSMFGRLKAGPALSLPNMLVIRSVMGTKKTVVFVSLVIVMATISGLFFGRFFA